MKNEEREQLQTKKIMIQYDNHHRPSDIVHQKYLIRKQ